MATITDPVRTQLHALLDHGNAHMTFDDAVDRFPAEAMNRFPPNVSYTPWHLVEHLRRTQRDILDYIRDGDYEEMTWPDEYWPARDATADEAAIDEVNTGIFCFRRSLLSPALRRINPDNAQGELYLTDVVEVLAEAGHKVVSVVAADASETHGVNDRAQLAAAEAQLRARTNRTWQARGVTLVDPDTTYIDATVQLAADVTVFPGAILQGRTRIGEGVDIGPGCRLVDCIVGERSKIEHTVARTSEIGADCTVGPYAVLEPGSQVPPGTRTGPFYTGSTAAGLEA